jgi:hypothetical protein
MPTPAEIVRDYFAAWNEPDEGARRKLLNSCWADSAAYTDPTAEVEGRDALVAHIASYIQQMPGTTIVLTSGIDEHHGRMRFTWAMLGTDGTPMVEGIDFARLGKDGRLGGVTGFFGPPPEP